MWKHIEMNKRGDVVIPLISDDGGERNQRGGPKSGAFTKGKGSNEKRKGNWVDARGRNSGEKNYLR